MSAGIQLEMQERGETLTMIRANASERNTKTFLEERMIHLNLNRMLPLRPCWRMVGLVPLKHMTTRDVDTKSKLDLDRTPRFCSGPQSGYGPKCGERSPKSGWTKHPRILSRLWLPSFCGCDLYWYCSRTWFERAFGTRQPPTLYSWARHKLVSWVSPT